MKPDKKPDKKLQQKITVENCSRKLQQKIAAEKYGRGKGRITMREENKKAAIYMVVAFGAAWILQIAGIFLEQPGYRCCF